MDASPTAALGPDHRARVVAFLAFFTSDVCLEAVRSFVAPEQMAAELCRLWFDEIYVPGDEATAPIEVRIVSVADVALSAVPIFER